MSGPGTHIDHELKPAQEFIQRIGILKRTAIIPLLNAEMATGHSTFENVMAVISNDPPMSQRVIDVSNSAWFGGRLKVDTIEEALLRMGVKEFYNVVIIAALKAGLGQGRGQANWWTHVENVARDCELMARCLSREHMLPAFLAGLLHDYAVPFMARVLDGYTPFAADALACTPSVIEQENQRFKMNHCVVGAALLSAWQFPAPLVEAVRYHHQMSLAAATSIEGRRVLALLMLTERLDSMCRNLISVMFGESREEALLGEIAFALEVTREKLNEVLAEVARLYRLRQAHG